MIKAWVKFKNLNFLPLIEGSKVSTNKKLFKKVISDNSMTSMLKKCCCGSSLLRFFSVLHPAIKVTHLLSWRTYNPWCDMITNETTIHLKQKFAFFVIFFGNKMCKFAGNRMISLSFFVLLIFLLLHVCPQPRIN